MTNAHVSGTDVGRSMKVRIMIDGQPREYNARIMLAAYSSRYATDWAVLAIAEPLAVQPRPMSKEKPLASRKYITVGSPRCVWPQATQNLSSHRIQNNSPWWDWLPVSIPGQSGSAVWDTETGIQYGLLTWSSGNRGAGQQTAEIYRQAVERTVVSCERPAGIKDVTPTALTLEDGFFGEAGITDLPIWDNGETPPPIEDPEDDNERKLLDRLRDRTRERGFNWINFLRLLLRLLDELPILD